MTLRKALAAALMAALALAGCQRAPSTAPSAPTSAVATGSSALAATPSPVPSEAAPSPTSAAPVIAPCAFRPTPVAPSARPVAPPPNGAAPTEPEAVEAVIETSQGDVPVSLSPGRAPCAVLSFLRLAEQHFFDNTACHRLTTESIYVLQCGDPTGTGTGGPGYSFADEYPLGSGASPSPAATLYTRGTLAMANSGPDTNGSQFFLVYKDSPLPPHYTIFGSIGEAGLSVLDKIAAGGVAANPMGEGDGQPKIPVRLAGIQVS